MEVYPSSRRCARFCSAAATAEGKYPYSLGRSKPTEALGASWEAAAGTSAAVDLAAADVTETHPRRAEDPPRRARSGRREGGTRGADESDGGGHVDGRVSGVRRARRRGYAAHAPGGNAQMRVDIGRRDSPAGARFVVANDHVVDAREVPPLGRDETRTTPSRRAHTHLARRVLSGLEAPFPCAVSLEP